MNGGTTLADVVPVILAGGEGRRLRPLSRPAAPKPFLKLCSRQSLLQKTLARCEGMSPPVIVCNRAHYDLVRRQAEEGGFNPGLIVLEPAGRNTAPALTAAAHILSMESGPNALMLVMPSDHEIAHPEKLKEAVARGLVAAREGWLVTFGITPRAPDPHFGYIGGGAAINGAVDVRGVSSFVEKPPPDVARRLVGQGYVWNSGIFLFSVQSWLTAIQKYSPETYDCCAEAAGRSWREGNAVFLEEENFARQPSVSIDRAVMEKTDRAAVVALDMPWRDLGTWRALAGHLFEKVK